MTVLSLGLGATKGNLSHDQRLSTCNVCGLGVFHRQVWVWCRDPMGIVHAACKEGLDRG